MVDGEGGKHGNCECYTAGYELCGRCLCIFTYTDISKMENFDLGWDHFFAYFSGNSVISSCDDMSGSGHDPSDGSAGYCVKPARGRSHMDSNKSCNSLESALVSGRRDDHLRFPETAALSAGREHDDLGYAHIFVGIPDFGTGDQ